MRKKDLKIGEIYADNYSKPVLLVHDGVWSKKRHGTEWFLHPSNAKQEKGRGYLYTDKGMLVVQGSAGDLKQIEVPEIHVFEETRNYITETYTKTLAEFEASLPEGCYLTVGFSRSWKGPFDAVEEADRIKYEDRDRRRAEAMKIAERRNLRVENIRQALAQRSMRVHGTTLARIGEPDLHMSGYNGVTLSLDDLEELLDLDSDDVPDWRDLEK